MVTSQAQRVRQDHRENRGFRAYQEKTESRGQKEIPGPVGPVGPPGRDANAAITSLDPGIFAMSVESGHLLLTYNGSDPAPPLKIVEGRLVYILDEVTT